MKSRLIACLMTLGFAGPLVAAPLDRCAAWLGTASAEIDRKKDGEQWLQAVRDLPDLEQPPRTRFADMFRRQPRVVTDETTARDDLRERLKAVQSDLLTLKPEQIALNQKIVGEDNIRRHLVEITRRAAERAPGSTPEAVRFRKGRFTADGLKALTYASIASLLYVVGVEAAWSDRFVSVGISVMTGVMLSARARAFVLRGYHNLVNGWTQGRAMPLEVSEVADAEVRHAERLITLLDQTGGRLRAYLGMNIPVPLSASASKTGQTRKAPRADQLDTPGAWPVDPRELAFDQILYFDRVLLQPVLLTFVRESRDRLKFW